MNQKSNARRRYRLHQRIKGVLKYSSRERTVYISHLDLELLQPKHKRAIIELSNKFGYNIQTQIPNHNDKSK